MDRGMDAGLYTFLTNIPPGFQRDVLAGKAPALQLNVDANAPEPCAEISTGYIQNIVNDEIRTFAQRRAVATQPVDEQNHQIRETRR